MVTARMSAVLVAGLVVLFCGTAGPTVSAPEDCYGVLTTNNAVEECREWEDCNPTGDPVNCCLHRVYALNWKTCPPTATQPTGKKQVSPGECTKKYYSELMSICEGNQCDEGSVQLSDEYEWECLCEDC